jgi:DNA invertase Pin-like site-specific DNA recombinase
MKAVGSIRFSSEDQGDGDSIARQTRHIQEYCGRIGLDLAETLIDEGLSAFKGDHLTRGRLGSFFAEVEAGKRKGQALVVEHLDRLSRLGISDTGDLLRRLLKGGVVVHLSQSGRVIESMDDLATAILAIVDSHAAKQYSARLRERVGSSWQRKKHSDPNGTAITSRGPGWLVVKLGKPIEVDAGKAAIVRDIFRMAAAGMGKRLIASKLNAQGVPVFGGGRASSTGKWHQAYVQSILANRAVLGEYQPKFKGGKPDGESRIGFYPQIIDAALWQEAQRAISERRTVTGGGVVTGKHSGRTGKANNVFSGLVVDCDGADRIPMSYVDKGGSTRPRLVSFQAGTYKVRHGLDYAHFESAFLRFLDQLDWKGVLGVAESQEIQNAEQTLARVDLEIERTKSEIQKIVNILIDTPSQALKARLTATEAKLTDLEATREAAARSVEELHRTHEYLLDSSTAYSQLAESKSIETRIKLRQEIARKVRRIECHFDAAGQKGYVVCFVMFTNGAMRGLVFNEGDGYFATIHSEPTDPTIDWIVEHWDEPGARFKVSFP